MGYLHCWGEGGLGYILRLREANRIMRTCFVHCVGSGMVCNEG